MVAQICEARCQPKVRLRGQARCDERLRIVELDVRDRLALLGSANWQNWSQFGLVGISISTANPKALTTNLQYQDTWQIAAGAQYKLSPELLLSAGFAYDSDMVTDSTRTVSAPVGAQYRYAAGARVERAPDHRVLIRVHVGGLDAVIAVKRADQYHYLR